MFLFVCNFQVKKKKSSLAARCLASGCSRELVVLAS
jgi:hypothetical protein